MNQCLKNAVYNKGTDAQAKFMAELGGMHEEEYEIFMLIHKGHTDLFIQEERGITKPAYQRIEDSIRSKLLLAVFECINYKMNH